LLTFVACLSRLQVVGHVQRDVVHILAQFLHGQRV
jgi:hypothetical protein